MDVRVGLGRIATGKSKKTSRGWVILGLRVLLKTIVLLDGRDEGGKLQRLGIYVDVSDLCCCTAEINTTL